MTPITLAALLMTQPAVDTAFLRQYAQTRGYMLGRPAKVKFSPDGGIVYFLRSGPTNPAQSLFAFDVKSKQTTEVLTAAKLLGGAAEELSPEEKARRERQRVSAGGFADYHLSPSGTHVLVSLSGRLFLYILTLEHLVELKTGPGAIDPKWSPDGTKVSYVRGFDVYAYDLASHTETAVTTGGTRTRTHGLAEFVAQEEMGRHTGYWWSPDSKSIAYTEADHAGVEVWHLADPFKPDAAPVPQFYPRPGKKNVSVRLGIVPVGGGKTVWVEWDRATYEYLAQVSWQKYGVLTLQVQGRSQQSSAYLIAHPVSGRTVKVIAEEDAAFLNIHPGNIRWMKDGRTFNLILQNVRGMGFVSPATCGFLRFELFKDSLFDRTDKREPAWSVGAQTNDDFRELVSNDPATGRVVYAGVRMTNSDTFEPDPTQSSLYRYNFLLPNEDFDKWKRENGPLPVCQQQGVYSGTFQDDLSFSAITKTTLTSLPTTTVFQRDWSAVADLPAVALDPPFTPNVTVAKVGDYWTAVVRPRNFDPSKKYPVIVDVYGGPRHLHVVQAMRNWLVPQWLADQGFVVVAIDNRGTPGRGREWERSVYQKFGTVPLDDQVKGLQALAAKHPELDTSRVGIVGWSFGGYMAANAVLRRPDVFHAAVAGAPVTDWEDYDTHYTERYMGLLPESRAAYDDASLIPLAKNLSRPLLLVHGTADDNVYYRHSLKLADALFRAGKPFELLPLPGVTHMYTADPAATERLWERSVGFFRQHLGGPK